MLREVSLNAPAYRPPRATPSRRRGLPAAKAAASLAETLERVLAEHVTRAEQSKPELMLDRDVRLQYFPGVGRSTYWQLAKQPDFPRPIVLGPKLKLRKRSEIEAWLLARQQ
jgi:predicted DNA-binding transcriptional regulator AlpA